MKKRSFQWMMPFGMFSVVLYFIHVFLGQALYTNYNWVTMDISSLTASGAPNAALLSIFSGLAGLCAMVFFTGMVLKTGSRVRTAYILLLVMMTLSTVGYALFPLEGDKTVMTFSNLMHIMVTAGVVVLVIAGLFILASGYRKENTTQRLGNVVLVTAIFITLTGALNPIGMGSGWNILGITERLNIFTLEIFIFMLSAFFTLKRAEQQHE